MQTGDRGVGLPSEPPTALALDDWLALLETRRRAMLMELSGIDAALIKYGRLKPKRRRVKG